MKKLIALILCLMMLVSLAACGGEEAAPTEEDEHVHTEDTTTGEADEHADHNHISYREQQYVFTPEELTAIEGRECDFTYEQNESVIYIYNAIEVDGMDFTQAQFTFAEDHNRISCTYTADKGTEEAPRSEEDIFADTEGMMTAYRATLTEKYGEGVETEQHGSKLISWSDHTGNYIILTRINDTTIQVAFYIYAVEG